MRRHSIVARLCLFYLGLFGNVMGQVTQLDCPAIGAFEINDGTCRNYYICVDNGVILVPVLLSCAPTAIFDVDIGQCVSEDTATCQQTTIAPPTTVAQPCFRYGRFPIPDVDCKRYYLCYWNGMVYTIMDNLTCPNALIFEPVSEKCVPPQRYACPGLLG